MKDEITLSNIADYYNNEFKVEQKLLSDTITNNIKDVLESIDFYGDDKDIAHVIDEFIARINQERSQFKNRSITDSIPKQQSITTQKKDSTPKKKAIQKVAEKQPNLLNKFPNSLMIIKRFASLVKNQKTKDDFLKLLKKIKKDMIDISVKKADIGTAMVLEIQSLLNGWIIEKNKKPDTELKQVYEKATELLQEYKVNPWATLQKYAITNIDNNTQEFKTKLQNRKNKLQKTMDNDKLKNLNPKEPVMPLAGLGGYKWKPSRSQRREFAERMQNDSQYAADYYQRKEKKAQKRRDTSQFDYSTAGGMFVPTKAQNEAALEMVSKQVSIKQLQAANDVLFGYSTNEKVHHDSIHIVNEYIRSGGQYNDYNQGLQGTTVYMPKMPAWVNRLRDFVHKQNHIKSYSRNAKIIIGLLSKIQNDFRQKIIKKADKGAALVDHIQHYLIAVIKQKKWDIEKAKKLSAKAIELTKNYKINPTTKLIGKALKNPTFAMQEAKKLKGEYKYRSVVSSVALKGVVPLLSNKPVKKKI